MLSFTGSFSTDRYCPGTKSQMLIMVPFIIAKLDTEHRGDAPDARTGGWNSSPPAGDDDGRVPHHLSNHPQCRVRPHHRHTELLSHTG